MEKKTVRQLVGERANDPSRWDDDPDGSGDASTLAASPPGADNDPEQAAAEFDALVRMIATRDKTPLAQAATRARQEHPDKFAA